MVGARFESGVSTLVLSRFVEYSAITYSTVKEALYLGLG